MSFYRTIRHLVFKFHRRRYESVSKFNVGIKAFLHQNQSEPECYSDLLYKVSILKALGVSQ